MRSHYGLDWSSGVIGALQETVRHRFPHRLRDWPTLQTFNYQAFQLSDQHFALVFEDKLSGIPAGPGSLHPFPYGDFPTLPPTEGNIDEWLEYLDDKFQLRNEDFAMVLPIYDAGKHGAQHDYELFSPSERRLFEYQLNVIVERQGKTLRVNEPPTQIIYNLSGTNARFNINSVDSSVNVVSQAPEELFKSLREAIKKHVADKNELSDLLDRVNEMEAQSQSPGFAEAYSRFMALAANHMSVLAPFIPALTQLISGS